MEEKAMCANSIIRNMNGDEIHSVDEWFKYAPPKMGIRHWKDKRSAKEAAKAWIGTGKPVMPIELKSVLDTHQFTKDFYPDWVIPEMITVLDNFKGEHRNQDLGISGASPEGKVFISVEAKADEPFDKMISMQISNAKEGSKIPARIEGFSKAIFGRPVDDRIGQLKYQLLTGLAGALIEAKSQNADYAVFIVHEFISRSLDAKKLSRNSDDFQMFFEELTEISGLNYGDGKLHEIRSVPGGEFVPAGMPLLSGKIQTQLT